MRKEVGTWSKTRWATHGALSQKQSIAFAKSAGRSGITATQGIAVTVEKN